MNALEFMQLHADNACAGKIADVMKDLTPEAMTQLGPLLAGAPNPIKTSKIVAVSEDGGDYIFDVTYFGEGGKSVSLRDTILQIDGTWKIAALAAPA